MGACPFCLPLSGPVHIPRISLNTLGARALESQRMAPRMLFHRGLFVFGFTNSLERGQSGNFPGLPLSHNTPGLQPLSNINVSGQCFSKTTLRMRKNTTGLAFITY